MLTPIKKPSIKFVSTDFQLTKKHSQAQRPKLAHSKQLDYLQTFKPSTHFDIYPDRKLRVHQFMHIKNNRAKLINWYLEIFSYYELDWTSFWLAVELLDTLIADFNYVSRDNVQIVGVVCCFMAAKMEGLETLNLKKVVREMCRNKFSKQEILMEEGKILHIIIDRFHSSRINVYSYLMEKYSGIPNNFILKGLQLLVLAFMKPEISFPCLRVSTYRQLVDCVMIAILIDESVPVLEEIRGQIMNAFGTQNVTLWAKRIKM